MAKLEFETPVKNIRGKISSYERIITRTRNGKTHSYIVHKPYKGPHSEKQTQAFSTFAQAVNRCKQEMNDPDKLAAWQSQYNAYRKNLAKHPAPQGTKTYSTLRGYIIAGLIQLSKSLPLQIMLLLFYALPSWAQQSIPYTYGFENNNLAAEGWTVLNLSSNNATEFGINNSAAHDGNYGFRFSSYNKSTAYDQYLFSPELDGTNGILLQFYYRTYDTHVERFQVGYSTTDTSPASFTWIDNIQTLSDHWTLSEQYVCPVGTKYIAIHYFSTFLYRLYVDDFTFSMPSSCFKPLNVQVRYVTADSAYFHWTTMTDSAMWQYTLTPHSQTPDWTNAPIISDTILSLTGLTDNTEYDLHLRMYCDADNQSDAVVTTFRTTCDAISSFPWTEDFEQGTYCWTMGNVQNPTDALYIPASSLHASRAHTGSGSLAMSALFYEYDGTPFYADSAYAILPEFHFGQQDISDYTLRFYAKSDDDYPSYNQHLYVGIVTHPDSILTFTQVADLTLNTTYQPYEVSFADYQGNGQHIALLATISKTYSNWVLHGDFHIDDMELFATPVCRPLESLTVSDTDFHSMVINLQPKTGVLLDTCQLVYSETPLDVTALDSTPKTIITQPTDTIGNLNPETTYYIYVRSVCPGLGYSAWSSTSATTKPLSGCEQVSIGGNSGGDSYTPIAPYYHNSYTQQLYLASEIAHAPDTIDKIAFAYDFSSSTKRNITIYMANTHVGALNSFIADSLVQVFTPKDIEFNNDDTWFTIDLDTPFAYSGANIIVAVYMNYTPTETNYGGGARFLQQGTGMVEWDNTLTGMSRYQTSDVQTTNAIPLVNGIPSTGFSDFSLSRPNIQFSFCYSYENNPTPTDFKIIPFETGTNDSQSTQPKKRIVDGHLFIIWENTWYDALGRKIINLRE